MGCYIWYSEEGTERDRSPPRPVLAVPNVTAPTHQRPVYQSLYCCIMVRCFSSCFNVSIKGLTLRDKGYSYRIETFRIDGQWIWDQAIKFTNWQRSQWSTGRGLLWCQCQANVALCPLPGAVTSGYEKYKFINIGICVISSAQRRWIISEKRHVRFISHCSYNQQPSRAAGPCSVVALPSSASTSLSSRLQTCFAYFSETLDVVARHW